MRTDDVLDQIDSAISDWEVSPDAMRCGAPADAPQPEPLIAADRWDEALLGPLETDWQQRWVAGLFGGPIVLGFDGPRDDGAVVACVAGRTLLVREPAREVQRFFLSSWVSPTITLTVIDETWAWAKRQRRRSGPEPLPIDGLAYHRRQRNRRGR